jgi:uncharacterized protein GlcG (DUF336 family)
MMSITLETALTIARAALDEGVARQLAPLCVVVLDAGAHPIAMLRADGASIRRPEIATAKAAGCLGMGFGGRELARRAQAMPHFFTAIGAVFPDGIVPVPGGVLIRHGEGRLLGAIGVSGDTSDNDEICALAGIAAAGLRGDTGA